MRLSLIAALLLSSTILAGAQDAQKEFPAKLLGHALLPANTIIAAPADGPADLKVSGKFTTPGKRIGGFLIDVVIMLVINIPVVIVMFLLLAQTSTDTFGNTYRADLGLGGQLLINLVTMAIYAAYHIGFVAVKGQTPGAMLVKVKVVRLADGQIPGGGPATMRWVPNLVGLVPCLGPFLSLGLWIWALVNLFSNERRQTPFDLAAKTVVIDAA